MVKKNWTRNQTSASEIITGETFTAFLGSRKRFCSLKGRRFIKRFVYDRTRLNLASELDQRLRTKMEAEVGSKTIPDGLFSGFEVFTRPK